MSEVAVATNVSSSHFFSRKVDAIRFCSGCGAFAPVPSTLTDTVVDENGDERPPTQFITTTFRPELIHAGDQFYGVSHRGKASTVKTISKEEALRIISETASRSKQHVGGKDN